MIEYTLALILLATTPSAGLCVAVQPGAKTQAHASATFEFSNYMVTFARSYDTAEYDKRRTAFMRNVRRIQSQNSMPTRLWTAGINPLTDWTDEELTQLLGWRSSWKQTDLGIFDWDVPNRSTPPESVDWTHLSMSSDIPWQGRCGSCWAMAASSMLEARYEAQTNETRTFSAQHLVNCVPNPSACGGRGGCTGSTVELALDYILQNGLVDDDAEPYVGTYGDCAVGLALASTRNKRFLVSPDKVGFELRLQSWYTLPENKVAPLMIAVADGPVAIAVDAHGWFHYESGIFDSCDEDAILDHSVVLFGYGKDSVTGIMFWNVRNSWGNLWGEKGFIRLLRRTHTEEENYCGTNRDPSMGVACKPYPDSVRVCGTCGLLYRGVVATLGSA